MSGKLWSEYSQVNSNSLHRVSIFDLKPIWAQIEKLLMLLIIWANKTTLKSNLLWSPIFSVLVYCILREKPFVIELSPALKIFRYIATTTTVKHNGLFHKISTPPPPPQWTTVNWVPKNFRISKKDNCSFCKIPEPPDSKSWGFQNFCKTLNGFLGIPVKIYKIWRNLWISIVTERFLQDFQCRPWGVCVDIFWNSPI